MEPIIPSIIASSIAEYLSEAIDLDRTTPPDPAIPWTSLIATNWEILFAKMQPAVAKRKRVIAMISGIFLPYRSLSGPKISCPTASPIMLVVRPSCTMEEDVPKYPVISGSVGRYMSMTNGPNALRSPRNRSMNIFELGLRSFMECRIGVFRFPAAKIFHIGIQFHFLKGTKNFIFGTIRASCINFFSLWSIKLN